MISIEAGRQDLLFGRVGQHIAGQLPCQEFIKGLIHVERFDHPIAPWPHIAHTIILISMTISIARHVHPLSCHTLTIGFAAE